MTSHDYIVNNNLISYAIIKRISCWIIINIIDTFGQILQWMDVTGK